MSETSAPSAESLVVCLDNSDYMRNEDYVPTRWDAQKQACTWMFNGDEPPSMFSLVSMAGKRPEVISKSALDIVSIEDALQRASISNKCNIQLSIQLAQMVLRSRPPKSTISRIIIFSGSPSTESLETMSELGRTLKKNKINLDVIAFGDASRPQLQALVDACDVDGNCHLIDSPPEDTLAVGMVSLVAPEVASNLVSTPAAPSSPEQDIPSLKLPPPNRVCRRVAVDPIKLANAMHRSRLPLASSNLSISLTLSLSTSGSKNSKPRDSTVVLLVPVPSRRSQNVLLEFRVGRCQFKSRREVIPLRKKGQLSLIQVSSNAYQIVWRHRTTQEVEFEIVLHPGEATFTKVETPCPTDRVYCLHVTHLDQRHFFWMQHNDIDKDESYCSLINETLAAQGDYKPPGLEASVFSSLSASELQQLLFILARPLAQRALNGSEGVGRSTPNSVRSYGLNKLSRSDGGAAIESSRQRWVRNPLFAADDAPHHSSRFRRSVPLRAVEKTSSVDIPLPAPELTSSSPVEPTASSSSPSIGEIVHKYDPPSDTEDGPV